MCVFIHISPTQQSLYLILISDSYSKLSDIWPDWVLWNENRIHAMCDHFTNALINKCIGDDAKAAARQSPNCIKKTKINKIWRKTIFNMADGILTPYNVARSWHWFRQVTAPCDVACSSGIMTVNSSSGSRPTCNVTHGSGMICHWIRQVACDSGIMTVNSSSGSILQCGRWQRDGMSLNSPKRPPYWNSTFGFDFGHISAVDMSFCTSLRNFIQIGPTSAKKWRHVDFQDDGSPPSWIFGVQ